MRDDIKENTVVLSLQEYHRMMDDKKWWQKECLKYESISIIPELEMEISNLKLAVQVLKSKRWWQR